MIINAAVSLFIALCICASASYAQSAVVDISDGLLGRWETTVSSTEIEGAKFENEKSTIIEIKRIGENFAVEMITFSGPERNRKLKTQSSIFRLTSLGILERNEKTAQTWEPGEFPTSISQKIELSKNGKIIIVSTVYSGQGKSAIPGTGRKLLKIVRKFHRADSR